MISPSACISNLIKNVCGDFRGVIIYRKIQSSTPCIQNSTDVHPVLHLRSPDIPLTPCRSESRGPDVHRYYYHCSYETLLRSNRTLMYKINKNIAYIHQSYSLQETIIVRFTHFCRLEYFVLLFQHFFVVLAHFNLVKTRSYSHQFTFPSESICYYQYSKIILDIVSALAI